MKSSYLSNHKDHYHSHSHALTLTNTEMEDGKYSDKILNSKEWNVLQTWCEIHMFAFLFLGGICSLRVVSLFPQIKSPRFCWRQTFYHSEPRHNMNNLKLQKFGWICLHSTTRLCSLEPGAVYHTNSHHCVTWSEWLQTVEWASFSAQFGDNVKHR